MERKKPDEAYKALKKLPRHLFDALPIEVHTAGGKMKVLSAYLDKGKLIVDVK